MHGQIRLQGRHGLLTLVKRTAIKMDLSGRKGIEIIGGAYEMIKGDHQKEISQEYQDSTVRAYYSDCRYRVLVQSIENNHPVPMGGNLFAVWEPYNNLGAEVSDNLTVTDSLAVFE